jgi:hypothetical protein
MQHRDNDLPPMVCCDGELNWYQNGLVNRDTDLPARTTTDGRRVWYWHEKVIATTIWYQSGMLHRDNYLPAKLDASDDSQHWYRYQNDKRHCDRDFLAIVGRDGAQAWYQNDVYIRSTRFHVRVLPALCPAQGSHVGSKRRFTKARLSITKRRPSKA